MAPDGTPYTCEILAGPIAAVDLLDARIVPHPGIGHWANARGVVRYRDLVGGSYETRFESKPGPGDEIAMTVYEQTHTTAAESMPKGTDSRITPSNHDRTQQDPGQLKSSRASEIRGFCAA